MATEITLDRDDLGTIVNEGSVVMMTGTDAGTGDRVTFAGDAGLMWDLVNGIVNEGEAVAQIEDWQVLGQFQV